MRKLTDIQILSIKYTVSIYIVLRIVLFLMCGGYWGYLVIGLFNLLGFALFQVLIILFIYAKLKKFIDKRYLLFLY